MKKLMACAIALAASSSGCVPTRLVEIPSGQRIILVRERNGEESVQIVCKAYRSLCLTDAQSICQSRYDIIRESSDLDVFKSRNYVMSVRCLNPSLPWSNTNPPYGAACSNDPSWSAQPPTFYNRDGMPAVHAERSPLRDMLAAFAEHDADFRYDIWDEWTLKYCFSGEYRQEHMMDIARRHGIEVEQRNSGIWVLRRASK